MGPNLQFILSLSNLISLKLEIGEKEDAPLGFDQLLKLTKLNIGDYDADIDDFSQMASLKELTYSSFRSNPLQLVPMTGLTSLHLRVENVIPDFTDMLHLEKISFVYSNFRRPCGLPQALKSLSLETCYMLNDISPLSTCNQLENLNIVDTPDLSSVSALSSCQQLKSLCTPVLCKNGNYDFNDFMN